MTTELYNKSGHINVAFSDLVGEGNEAFLQWVERLECGVDLLTQNDYRVP